MHAGRIRLLSEDVYSDVLHTLHAEPEIDGQLAFLRSLGLDIANPEPAHAAACGEPY